MGKVKAELKRVVVKEEVVLTLPMKHARAIQTLVGALTGSGEFRGLADEIYYALKEQSITSFKNANGSYIVIDLDQLNIKVEN